MLGRISHRLFPAIALFTAAVALGGAAWAQSAEQVILNFTGKNGNDPYSRLISDASGRIFGTTAAGGGTPHNGSGEIFELIPKVGGGWNFHKLYAFQGNSAGAGPVGNIVFDAAGNLYGAVQAGEGGVNGKSGVYKASPGSGGQWTESIIALIDGTNSGATPLVSGLTIDAAGNLYGTTRFGGVNGLGSIYQLTPNSDGSWTQNLLYSFGSQSQDGTDPNDEVTFDASGNIYGTTFAGGASGYGAVYRLFPASGGGWNESVLYSFTGGDDEGNPVAALWLDAAGNIYGTTPGAVSLHFGTVFSLTQNSGGSWTYRTLHHFGKKTGDGSSPESGLTPDAAGNLFGTTALGGTYNKGSVYELTRTASGNWEEKVLVSLVIPEFLTSTPPPVTIGRGHILYGVTSNGGSAGFGVVFEVVP
jgi:uncharacterized repeat protein (TIGR03803 family)